MLYRNSDNVQKKKRECSPKLLIGASKYKVLRGPPPKHQKEKHRGLLMDHFGHRTDLSYFERNVRENVLRQSLKKNRLQARINPYSG